MKLRLSKILFAFNQSTTEFELVKQNRLTKFFENSEEKCLPQVKNVLIYEPFYEKCEKF